MGKILKIASNDLYGNVDERKVVVFACFNHLKYMNKYVIFSFLGEYDKGKLYYGSVHVKNDTLIIFSVKGEVINYINKFKDDYLKGAIDSNEYQLIDINEIKKVELVSCNNTDCSNLYELEALSIEKDNEDISLNEKKKRPVFLYILLIILILFLIGITCLYLNPDIFSNRMKYLECTATKYNHDLGMNYQEVRTVKFDESILVKEIRVVDSYQFLLEKKYIDFKTNERHNDYFKIEGTFKYDDENQTLKISYSDESIIDNYQEMKDYLIDSGYSCIEGYYDE